MRSQYTSDVKFREVVYSQKSEDHIARHYVTMSEVRQVILHSSYWITRGKKRTYVIYGRTYAGRYLLIVVAPRLAGAAYIVTARDMNEHEKKTFLRKVR
jgi:uncharacterized protein